MNTASNTQRNLEATAWFSLEDAYTRGFLHRQADGYYGKSNKQKVEGSQVQVKLTTGDILAVA